ncbi:glycosyltransferase involved in cell wall biosynthesis [Humitalea rosea]|uniref:Glycosyltransferase involved in cell wall biosynthesis n=1 Tax=Humitalea rosea TaxID=990373 RepID=A0A2W7J4G8_9PROT|nr:glycosyltransferase family 4 protein [Humitalea rosea]PZW45973.1 glycosyltransferase involved in cell wall biosynthesis [Humitalea rosea]
MRIALVTPYNQRSAISSWARLVAFELHQRGHEVTIIRAESMEPSMDAPLALPPLDAPGAIVAGCDIEPAQLVAEHDAILYALGNHFGHHGEVPRLLLDAPGVVVLHDTDMSDFRNGWAFLRGESEAPPAALSPEALLGWFAARATGAVVHANFYAAAVRQFARGPVAVLRLSFPDLEVPPPRARKADAPLIVATIGDANANKRHDIVVEAIGQSDMLRGSLRYRILGHAQPERMAELSARAEALGVEIDFSGWLSHADLQAAVAEADVLCCLRWPVTEGSSGSAILGLLSGRPVIVPDVGSFRDLPDRFVMRVPAGDEFEAVTRHLSIMLRHPEVGPALGASARAWARETFHPAHYADGVLALLARIEADRPMTALMGHLRAEAREFGLAASDPLVLRAWRDATRAFGSVGDGGDGLSAD